MEKREEMHNELTEQLRGFDLLNQAAQQRLRARVADAGGDIAAVASEIRAQLDEVDQNLVNQPDMSVDRQSDRAFCIAQLTFLDILARMQSSPDQPASQGWLARLRTAFRGVRTAG